MVRRSNSGGSFKFNVAAPEFVPTLTPAPAQAHVPITGFFYPCFQPIDGTTGSWIYVTDQEIAMPLVHPKPNNDDKVGSPQNKQPPPKEIAISEEIKRKIIKQKLKSMNVNNQMVAQALRLSSKLVVSSDGKKVKRKIPFTEKEKEELQMRTVIAENLPDDHSHQKIEKMFNVVGSIKSIRICQPQEHNASRSNKSDVVVSHKLHALVEYETAETAEKAAEKLNDEGNWRKGMRVRLMLKRSSNPQPKTVVKSRKPETFDACVDDNGPTHHSPEDTSRYNTSETESDDNSKRSWSRNRAKSKHRPLQGARSLPTPSSHSMGSCPGQQPKKGPRMPDGTRGFTMGRGKPLIVPVLSS
ncbi:La-related protein 6C [Striga hermonthica]|uniref:La-related protein 6C n=1 Tax=Striga hermonthica TaxID=68872 RepID=A0A9N7N462_STRHE|nr:La-related protein 6C [Striga hermonthica]